jgi:hypothetical protein
MRAENEIRDELLESIRIGNVKIVLSEYIPCDRNTLESISEKLMAEKSLYGEFVTMLMDSVPESTTFVSEPRCNSVRVVDFKESEFIACEASMQDPHDVVAQKEVIGMFISHEGHVIYGADIVSIEDSVDEKEPTISLDKLARVLIDLMTDSSLMMDTLLTHHQRRLMDCIYKGTAITRYKFVGILAEKINPNFTDPSKYQDDEEYENEIEQIIDNLESVHRVNQDDTLLIVGEAGILIISKNWKEYELIATFFSLVKSAELFVDALFHRMSLLWDELKTARELIEKTSEGDYTVITKAQNILTEATANFTILSSILGYLTRGFNLIIKRWMTASVKADSKVKDLLRIDESFEELINRISDAELLLQSLQSELEGLQTLLSTQIEQQMRRVYGALRDNTRSTSEVIRASERTGDVLNVIELILSGSIAFDIVLAITGEYTTPWGQLPADRSDLQFVYFAFSIALWLGIVISLKKGMEWAEHRVEKSHLIHMTINQKCDIPTLDSFLRSKEIISVNEDIVEDRLSMRVKYNHVGAKGNSNTTVTIAIDRKNGLLQDVVIDTQSLDVQRIKNEVLGDLESVFDESS